MKGLRCIGGEQLLELGLELHADADPEAACRVAAPQLPVQGRRREEREAAGEVGAGAGSSSFRQAKVGGGEIVALF